MADDNEIINFLTLQIEAVADSWTHKSELVDDPDMVKNPKTLVGKVASLKVNMLYH